VTDDFVTDIVATVTVGYRPDIDGYRRISTDIIVRFREFPSIVVSPM